MRFSVKLEGRARGREMSGMLIANRPVCFRVVWVPWMWLSWRAWRRRSRWEQGWAFGPRLASVWPESAEQRRALRTWSEPGVQ